LLGQYTFLIRGVSQFVISLSEPMNYTLYVPYRFNCGSPFVVHEERETWGCDGFEVLVICGNFGR
jgi:hypothetical protein